MDALLNFAATPKGLLLLQQTGAIDECVSYMFSRFTKKLQVCANTHKHTHSDHWRAVKASNTFPQGLTRSTFSSKYNNTASILVYCNTYCSTVIIQSNFSLCR